MGGPGHDQPDRAKAVTGDTQGSCTPFRAEAARRKAESPAIAPTTSPDLPPGGFASAEIKSGTMVAPMLPESAILSDNKGSYVYIVGKDNKVERRDIKLGMVTDHGIAIIAGLAGDERIVLRAGGFLSPGETIKPVVAK